MMMAILRLTAMGRPNLRVGGWEAWGWELRVETAVVG